jgi:hypothetical protein
MNLLKMRFENSLFYDLPATIINPEVSSAAIAAIIVRKHSKTQCSESNGRCILGFM